MNNCIEKVSAERLYRHILELEGPRHPIKNLDNLNAAADYIISEFNKIGLPTKQQKFTVRGFEEPFRNIEASLGDGSQPELLILSHYDTVENCPGANDNASSVALMLECAKVLASEGNNYNISFISFSLEEGNPYIDLKCKKKARELGMTDEKDRYTSFRIHNFMRKYDDKFSSFRGKGKLYLDAHQAAMEELKLKPPPLV